jgi:hypothetical protein
MEECLTGAGRKPAEPTCAVGSRKQSTSYTQRLFPPQKEGQCGEFPQLLFYPVSVFYQVCPQVTCSQQ